MTTPTENRSYQTEELVNFYSTHRRGWAGLYPSERHVIERMGITPEANVLDMGCACGGLGEALGERFGVTSYTGVEISNLCVAAARRFYPKHRFIAGDFLRVQDQLDPKGYDFAFSLGCADWNEQTSDLLKAVFSHVKPGGQLIFTCRLTNAAALPPIFEAEQHIAFSAASRPGAGTERAPYKMYKLPSALALITGCGPVESVYAYGYWGQVPATVIGSPVDRLHYAVFAIRKKAEDNASAPRITLDFALDFFS